MKRIILFLIYPILIFNAQRVTSQQSEWKATASLNQKWGIIDNKGNWILEPKYEELQEIGDDTYISKTNTKYGIVDGAGNTIIPPEFDELSFNTDGFYNAKQNNQF